jgi:hypothetical protein
MVYGSLANKELQISEVVILDDTELDAFIRLLAG